MPLSKKQGDTGIFACLNRGTLPYERTFPEL